MSDKWYFVRDGITYGPVSGQELKRVATAGKLLATNLVWREGMDKRVPARAVKGLFEPKLRYLPRHVALTFGLAQ